MAVSMTGNMADRLICSIYKSLRKDEMYIYVEKSQGVKAIPEALLSQFGQPQHVMDMLLSAEGKPLARADNQQVLNVIREQGFYLQMPPAQEEYLLDIDDILHFRDHPEN